MDNYLEIIYKVLIFLLGELKSTLGNLEKQQFNEKYVSLQQLSIIIL
jgi:hypothetical protein